MGGNLRTCSTRQTGANYGVQKIGGAIGGGVITYSVNGTQRDRRRKRSHGNSVANRNHNRQGINTWIGIGAKRGWNQARRPRGGRRHARARRHAHSWFSRASVPWVAAPSWYPSLRRRPTHCPTLGPPAGSCRSVRSRRWRQSRGPCCDTATSPARAGHRPRRRARPPRCAVRRRSRSAPAWNASDARAQGSPEEEPSLRSAPALRAASRCCCRAAVRWAPTRPASTRRCTRPGSSPTGSPASRSARSTAP